MQKTKNNITNRNVHFIRKSKWVLIIILWKIFVFLSLLIWISYLTIRFSSIIQNHWLNLVVLIIMYIIFLFLYINILISITYYFYNILIINHKSIYRIKLWLILSEYIYIIDLYKIQEVDSYVDWLLQVILNIWTLKLIEQNDKKNEIHSLDNPQEIAHIIREIQHKYVDKENDKSK